MRAPAPFRQRRGRSRRGIALILAIVVLAALLLLGLPFLVSQSSALTGTRAFRAAEQAGSVTDSALRIGVAVAATAMEDHLRPAMPGDKAENAPTAFTRLGIREAVWDPAKKQEEQPEVQPGWLPPFSIQKYEPNEGIPLYSVRLDRLLPQAFKRTGVSMPGDGAPAHRSLAAITIEDESGKLDPNTMSPAVWNALLEVVLGRGGTVNADWDDNEVLHSRFRVSTSVNNQGVRETIYHKDDDIDHFGELAKALAGLPHRLPGHRINDIDQLLLADPGHNLIATPKDYRYGYATPPTGSFGLRRPLTRSELDRLRPFLSLHRTPPGRQGLIDFGTVVARDIGGEELVIWDLPAWADRVYGQGTPLRQIAPDGATSAGLIVLEKRGDQPAWFMTNHGGQPVKDTAAAIHAQPVVNLNAASATVRRAVTGLGSKPVQFDSGKMAMTLDDLTIIKAGLSVLNDDGSTNPPPMELTAWHLQDPLRILLRPQGRDANRANVRVNLPPLGIAGDGIFTITAAGAVTDGAGRQESNRMRRQVVQALPHEHLLERRWTTQDAMHALVVRGFASNIDTWPNPVDRLLVNTAAPAQAWPAETQQEGVPEEEQAGFRPTVLPSWATVGQPQHADVMPRAPETADAPVPINWQGVLQPWIDWAMDFGARAPIRLGAQQTLFDIRSGWLTLSGPGSGGSSESLRTTTVAGVAQAVNPDPLGPADLRPDGLRLRGGEDGDGRHIKVPTHRFLRHVASSNGQIQAEQETAGRHFSLWVRPASDWSRSLKPIALFEARMNRALAVRPIKRNDEGQVEVTGVPGDEGSDPDHEFQSLLGLYFDPKRDLLALVIAPPTSPHLTALGPWIPWDDAATTDIDERCLGFGYSGTDDSRDNRRIWGYIDNLDTSKLVLQRLAPAAVTDPGKLALVSPLLGPNRIVTLFSVRRPDKDPYFQKDRWIQLQAVVASSRPGGNAILVDQIAGRDVMVDASRPDYMRLKSFGDHCTLPALPVQSLTMDTGADGTDDEMDPKAITAIPLTLEFKGETETITAEALFPARGMIRIGNEYLRYQSVRGNIFTVCAGGQRQQTNTNTANGDPQHWPGIQEHLEGDLILPGDFRIDGRTSGGDRLFKGGCALQDGWPMGDATESSPFPFVTWGMFPGTPAHPSITAVPMTTLLQLRVDPALPDAELPLLINADPERPGYTEQFPQRGIISITDYSGTNPYTANYGYKDTEKRDGLLILKLCPLDKDWTFKGDKPRNSGARVFTYDPAIPDELRKRAVFLISARISGPDPLTDDRYATDDAPRMFQLQHPTSGRIEWISYASIGAYGEDHFLVAEPDDKGWGLWSGVGSFTGNLTGRRGRMRTDCPARRSLALDGRQLTGHLSGAEVLDFPVDTPVIPVQTAVGEAGRLLATGDVVTIMPTAFRAAGDEQAVQAVVRYAATDGYSTVEGDPLSDVVNNYFAFAHHLPAKTVNRMSQLDILCGTCQTTPFDLSPITRVATLKGYHLPRIDGVEGEDTIIGGSRSAAYLGVDGTIDAVTAGPVPRHGSDPLRSGTVLAWRNALTPDTTIALSDSIKDLPCLVELDAVYQDLPPQMGLIRIGGEVFAYQTVANKSQNWLRLVARGLLGSARVAHRPTRWSSEDPDDEQRRLLPGEPFLILPNGPVAFLDGGIADTQFRFDNRAYTQDNPATKLVPNHGCIMDAPALLISEPDGSRNEVFLPYGGHSRRTPREDLVPRTDLASGITPNPNDHTHWLNYWQTSYTTAPWTRGLYNTEKQNWSGTGKDLRPIVIGWWPRHPSALPNSEPDNETHQKMLRARAYAWIGFPHGFRHAWFWPALLRSGESFASLSIPASSAIFNTEIRALAEGLDWTRSTPLVLSCGTTVERNLAKEPFDDDRQFNRPVDGVELRVHWRYAKAPFKAATDDHAGALVDLAENANTAPMLGPVSMRCLAPSRILATEPAR